MSLLPRRRVASILETFRPHAIHIATEGPLGWAARAWCRHHRTGFTTSYHTRFPEYISMRFPVPLFFPYRVIRRFHGAARRTMVATTDLRNELKARGFNNLVIWSRGVDTGLFHPGQRSGLSGERPLSVYVGRVAVEKNIEAFLTLDVPGTKHVIGGGPALDHFRARYPRVHFHGYKTGEPLAAALAVADVFVFPSRTDTFGVVMLEALACGLPVAAYPVTGPRQIIKNGHNGWLDADLGVAFARALTVNRHNCRATALEYSWQACAEQFLRNLHVISHES